MLLAACCMTCHTLHKYISYETAKIVIGIYTSTGHYDNTYYDFGYNYFTYNNFGYNNFGYNNFGYNDFGYNNFG